jgi:hypothetical protein
MVKRDHSNYVVAPNIYLDIKKMRLVQEVCTELALTFKLESMSLLKVERRHLAMNIVGLNSFW